MKTKIRYALHWLLGRHISAGLPEEERRSFQLTANTLLCLAIIVFLSWLPPVPENLVGLLRAVNIAGLLELTISGVLLRRGYMLAAQIFLCFATWIQLLTIIFTLPGQQAYMYLSVGMLLPLLVVVRKHKVARIVLALIPFCLLIAQQTYFKILGGKAFYGEEPKVFRADEVLVDVVGSQSLLLLLAYLFIRSRDEAEAKIQAEHKKSEQLLLNILPEEIAQELKEKGVSEPRLHRSATVCFTDFKGFTQIAETMSPTELVAELDRCFSYFDSVMERHNLEKLKTIGDSYMFAGGIPEPNHTHAIDCVMAALEIQAFMNQMKEIKANQNLPYWELRLGVHSGNLVAGVIGEKKFAYDVWSDTVNTASRCESSGIPGRINISGATYELVKDFFDCEYRGAVPAKNKGKIEMYFVNGLLSDLRRAGEERIPNEEFRKRYERLKGI
ncbi:adenylate/guanylate cyclase domain-containing protein [Leptospira semungkisensis]|uniref:Adenylate/guanylate cyclase domain-containing protein n=1 Tax=Leptospira semungkisensis TaxID=2484985 RepID=A0A4R9G924_9LEPT|nr:adenylate/guanylate cyclase domain-containing protein [Leptospira semungkisensis]TGK08041.1 adenylate/guanylate cyclase domain-containing protein [Leptospira semungkisensis]